MLPEPSTRAGRAGLAAVLAEPARALVAVDFDGTLAPIVERPEDARPAAGAVEALQALAARVGTCAVVTGRGAADVVSRAGFGAGSRLLVLGHYGLERWQDGRLDSPVAGDAVARARAKLPALLADAPAGVHVEDKHHALVVHTRPAADPAGVLAALTPRLERLAADLGLVTAPGRMVLELRLPGIDKGGALATLAAERSVGSVLYVGDDLGDLPAYDAVDALRRRGVPGLTVASVDPAASDVPPSLAERADLLLAGPAAVVDFLTGLVAAIGDV